VELLLKHGASVDIQNKEGEYPLHLAAAEDNREVVKLLLEHRSDPKVQDKNGTTPLHLAAMKNIPAGLLLLAFIQEVHDEKGKIVRDDEGEELLPQEVVCDVVTHLVDKFKEPTIKLLLGYNADPKIKDHDGRTPLYLIFEHDMCEYAEAKKDAITQYTNGKASFVKLLIKAGANVNERDNDGKTLLHYADRYQCTKIVKILRDNDTTYNDKSTQIGIGAGVIAIVATSLALLYATQLSVLAVIVIAAIAGGITYMISKSSTKVEEQNIEQHASVEAQTV
jgi:ankyrin repeat protein